MRRILTALLAIVLAGVSSPARAFVPQTINVDGVNDFDPANLLRDDRNDTQTNCSPAALPMDLGRVYMTNDANFLYIGIEFSQTCFCDMDLGMAFDVNTAAGGTTDPFGRKIGWANVPFKPDFAIYDVTPTSCNTFNYEILYKDSLGTWNNKSTLINPSWGSGSNGLGIVDSLNFKELKIPLSVLGSGVSLAAGTPMHVEFWVTQEGTTKGPLDALFSNNVQMSHVGTTTFDTTAVVQMTQMGTYTILNAIDNVPPTVAQAQAVNFAVQANRQFSLLTNKVDVTFSEPVDATTSQVAGNYAVSGPLARTVSSATRDAAATNVVHLSLNQSINANAAAYNITVTGVKDLAANAIVNNASTNVGSFFIQNLVFNGDFHIGLCGGTFAPSDTFAVEGNLVPLSFALCDNALMTDTNADSIYNVTVPFSLVKSRVTGKGEADLEWKFSHKCSEFEPLAGNRSYHITSDNGATATINAAWNNDLPANFTSRAMDVIFTVNASSKHPIGTDAITLLGGVLPLTFTQPGVPMLDNGVAPDQTAGDKIYSARVRFPACSPKTVNWKVDFDGVIECLGQGDRTLVLDDVTYSTTNPYVMPARGIDRCTVTDKALTVVFKVNMDHFNPLPALPADTVAVMGDQTPLRFDYPNASAMLLNDGVGFDTQAGDVIYTRGVTFPDSTPTTVNFKYWKDGVFECMGFPNRTMFLDDTKYSVASPYFRLLNLWDYCTEPTGVPYSSPPDKGGVSFANLLPVMPNPVTHRANFSFELRRSGRVALSLYDVSGRRVAKLLDSTMQPGTHTVSWDGLGEGGLRLESGVYLYELSMGGQRTSRRLIVTH